MVSVRRKIEAANADGTYAVAYDDGDREPRVDAAFVRVVLHGGGVVVVVRRGAPTRRRATTRPPGRLRDDDERRRGERSSLLTLRRARLGLGRVVGVLSFASRGAPTRVLRGLRRRRRRAEHRRRGFVVPRRCQRVVPRAPAATRDDAAAAAASAAATQWTLAHVEASYENDDFELPEAPDFVRHLAIGVGRRIGTGRSHQWHRRLSDVLPSTPGQTEAWRRACAARRGGCRNPSAATRSVAPFQRARGAAAAPPPHRAGRRARFHADAGGR